MRSKAAEAGIDITVDSAGIGAWHIGQLPDRRMRQCAKERGYDLTHRARQVSEEDFEHFDIIMGMDDQNISDLKRIAPSPEAEGRIRLMSDYLTRHAGQRSIPDPYYGDERDFEFALDLIEDAAGGIIERIKRGMI